MKLPMIEIGYQVYGADGEDPFGAVRDIAPRGQPVLTINVEGAGDFDVPFSAVAAVHAKKVVLALDALEPGLRAAIARAHEQEVF